MDNSRVSKEVGFGHLDAQAGPRGDQGKAQPAEGAPELVEEPLECVESSGNIFRDFGDTDADLQQAKALMGVQIMGILEDEALSTRQAEARSGVSHSEFSRIRGTKFRRFTLDRLITIIGRLGYDVDIVVDVRRRVRREGAAG